MAEPLGHRPQSSLTADEQGRREGRGHDVSADHRQAHLTHGIIHSTTQVDDNLADQEKSDNLARRQLPGAEKQCRRQHQCENKREQRTGGHSPAAKPVTGDRQRQTHRRCHGRPQQP